jgi:hypothetical protein
METATPYCERSSPAALLLATTQHFTALDQRDYREDDQMLLERQGRGLAAGKSWWRRPNSPHAEESHAVAAGGSAVQGLRRTAAVWLRIASTVDTLTGSLVIVAMVWRAAVEVRRDLHYQRFPTEDLFVVALIERGAVHVTFQRIGGSMATDRRVAVSISYDC